jgi:hypothetical protein
MMRAALRFLPVLVVTGGAFAEKEKPGASHRAEILSVLQNKFKYVAALTGAHGDETLAAPADVVPMKPFVVSAPRNLVSKLSPTPATAPFDWTKDVKVISTDVGGVHVDLGAMKYVPVIAEPPDSPPKITILKISF